MPSPSTGSSPASSIETPKTQAPTGSSPKQPAGSAAPRAARTDSFGDPYISDAQGEAITIGEPATTAFTALGGKAASGYNGQQAVPPLSYDYPISGTGDPDDPMDSKTVWWQICVTSGAVSGKHRANMDNLPVMGC